MLKRVLTRVDLPRPDSPKVQTISQVQSCRASHWFLLSLTNDHYIKVETLANTLAVPLVGQVGKTDIASKLPSDNVSGVLDRRSRLRRDCRSGVRRMNIVSRGRGFRLAGRR